MSKLTPETHNNIVKLIRIGVPHKHAAQANGIDERTYYNWMKWGSKRKEGPYFQFFQDIKKAESESIARDVAQIEKAASEGKWQASAWRLERRHPQEWALKTEQKIEHSGKIDNAITFKFETKENGDNSTTSTPSKTEGSNGCIETI